MAVSNSGGIVGPSHAEKLKSSFELKTTEKVIE
jgi:hypothetical protein